MHFYLLTLLFSLTGFCPLQKPVLPPAEPQGIKIHWVTLPNSNTPLIGVLLSDKKIHYFLLDSGAELMEMDRALAETLRLPIEKYKASGRDYELVYADANWGPDQITFRHLPFYLRDFKQIKEGKYAVEGILGINLLGRLCLKMDYQAKTLGLIPIEKQGEVPPGAIMIPLESEKNHCRRIKAVLDGHSVDLLLDTGGEETTLSDPALLKKIKPLAKVKGLIRNVSDKDNKEIIAVNSSLARLRSLKIGEIEWKDPVLSLQKSFRDFNVNVLGNDFLHRYKVTINFPANKLYLTPVLPLSDEDDKWVSTGAKLFYTEGRIRVDQVLEPSPASAAGLAVGDEVLSVNGTKVADTRSEQMQALLLRVEQKKEEVTLELRTLDEKRPKKVKLKFKKLL